MNFLTIGTNPVNKCYLFFPFTLMIEEEGDGICTRSIGFIRAISLYLTEKLKLIGQ